MAGKTSMLIAKSMSILFFKMEGCLKLIWTAGRAGRRMVFLFTQSHGLGSRWLDLIAHSQTSEASTQKGG
jgi:hypothetical protein